MRLIEGQSCSNDVGTAYQKIDKTPPTDGVVADDTCDPGGVAVTGTEELSNADTGGDRHTRRNLNENSILSSENTLRRIFPLGTTARLLFKTNSGIGDTI